MALPQFSKLKSGVRFSYPAPNNTPSDGRTLAFEAERGGSIPSWGSLESFNILNYSF